MKRSCLPLVVALAACGGTESSTRTSSAAVQQSLQAPATDVQPLGGYVLVYKTAKLRTAPDADAPYVQFITEDEDRELSAKLRQDWSDLMKQEQKDEEERAKKERERLKKEKEKAKKAKKRKKKKRKKRLTKKQKAELKQKKELEREKAKARKENAERKLGERINAKRRQVLTRYAPDGNFNTFLPFALVSQQNGWTRVRTLIDPDPTHCHQHALDGLAKLEADFYVKTSDLAETVTRSVRVKSSYGTEIALRPGVGIRNDRVYVDGHVLEVDVPRDAIGTVYEPVRPFEAPMTSMVFKEIAVAKDRLRLGSRERLPFNPYLPTYVSKTLLVGKKMYATLESQCAQISVRVSASDLETAGPRGTQRIGSSAPVAPSSVRPGDVVSVDGNAWGKAKGSLPISDNGAGCGLMEIWSGDRGKRSLEVCVK